MSQALGKAGLVEHLDDATASLAKAEAAVALLEAHLRLAEVALVRARRLAQEMGINVVVPVGGVKDVIEPYLSLDEFASLMRESRRAMQTLLKRMTEGLHYHFKGDERRHYVIHVVEARRFVETFRTATIKSSAHNIQQVAVDEVTRRRARAAMQSRTRP